MEKYKAMMSDREIEIIKGLLKPNFDCLEFGAGYSSVYFSQFVKSWYSIEHDWDWYFKVAEMIDLNNTKTKLIHSSEFYYLASAIGFSAQYNQKFDFILIDGILRKECLMIAMPLLKPNGIILLHDAGRFEYNDWINELNGEMLCDGEMPDPEHEGYYLIRGLKAFYGSDYKNKS